MPNFPEGPDGSVIIGGSYYRTGFLRAFMPIDHPNQSNIARRELILSAETELYHYTSLAGFKGIIDSSGFWASDNRFMNDSEEMVHGIKLADHVISYFMNRKTTSKGFYNILERTKSEISKTRDQGDLIACFSKSRDNLEQWRGYGPAGGICIKLGSRKASQRPAFIAPMQMAHKVFYEKREKYVLLLSILRRYEDEYNRDVMIMDNKWPHNHDEEYVSHLARSINFGVATFKNENFRHENEVRIVLSYDQADYYSKGVQFRATNFGIIPYICTGSLKGVDGPLPIDEVIVGPSSRQELIAESVKTFIYRNGYFDTRVSLSKIPFRSY